MQYRTLGRTGVQVSPYALGAMMFGAMSNPDHDDSIGIIHRALDAGINLIDTADMYSRGESEEIVGKALKGRRDDVVLATKVNGAMGEDPNRRGTSRRLLHVAPRPAGLAGRTGHRTRRAGRGPAPARPARRQATPSRVDVCQRHALRQRYRR